MIKAKTENSDELDEISVGEKRNSLPSKNKKKYIKRLPKDEIGIRPPKGFIFLPNADVRYTFPNAFCEQINAGDPDAIEEFVFSSCSPELTIIYEFDGEQNPHGDNHVEIVGREKCLSLWHSIFDSYPDYLINVLSTVVHHHPVTNCAFSSSPYKSTFTQIFKKSVSNVLHKPNLCHPLYKSFKPPAHDFSAEEDAALAAVVGAANNSSISSIAPPIDLLIPVEGLEDSEPLKTAVSLPSCSNNSPDDIFSYEKMFKADEEYVPSERGIERINSSDSTSSNSNGCLISDTVDAIFQQEAELFAQHIDASTSVMAVGTAGLNPCDSSEDMKTFFVGLKSINEPPVPAALINNSNSNGDSVNGSGNNGNNNGNSNSSGIKAQDTLLSGPSCGDGFAAPVDGSMLKRPVRIAHSGKIFLHLNSESKIEKIVYLFTFDE